MFVDYFGISCRTSSQLSKFGICDDPPPSQRPAYISESESDNWISIVENASNTLVEFYAIDNCVVLLRGDGKMESRCDGVLKKDLELIFVELKSRRGGQWFREGREQITKTIFRFKSEVDVSQFSSIRAQVCNSSKPLFNSGHAVGMQKFFDDTGYQLSCSQVIKI